MTQDYRHLRAWCHLMGSYDYYVRDQLDKARRGNAPADAIFEKYADDGSGPTGEWERFADVKNPETRLQIEQILRTRFPETTGDKGGAS